MKNIIEFYYDIKVHSIDIIDKYYFINNKEYAFCLVDNNLKIDNIVLDYCNKNDFNILMLNKYNKYITFYNKNKYLLFKIKKNIYDDNIDKMLIKLFEKKVKIDYLNWPTLWLKKINYYKNKIQNEKCSIVIKGIFEYYYQKTKYSISFANSFSKNELYEYVASHKRISKSISFFDFYNPLNIIFDVKERDVSDLIKNQLLEIDLNDDYLKTIINEIESLNVNYYLFISRLLYPSYFYDFIDKITSISNIDVKNIIKYEKIYINNIKKLINLLIEKKFISF